MTIKDVLKQYFGYESLREGQEPLISGLLHHRDVVGIMPTGAGKSLCYQVPALMMPGTAIVVSPLISLMADQVRALNQAGVHAAYINSSLTDRQIAKALQLAAGGRYKIIYVAPERLSTYSFLDCVRDLEVSLLAVDEAHCISQWGQDFRPDYCGISQFARQLSTRPAIGAFTATATQRVREDIIQSLELKDPVVVVSGFDRPNLYFRVAKRKGGRETDNAVVHYVRQHADQSGIIYCATRNNVDKLYGILLENGISAARYHAGMSSEERKQGQEDFIFDRKRVMVATNAFGMGIDKSDVRYVLHYNMPQSLEYYYQEAGRAGRDGEYAECVLFYSKQDIMINKYLIQRKSDPDSENVANPAQLYRSRYQKLQKMIDYCETDQCLRKFILGYFGENAPQRCDNCSNCVPVDETKEEDVIGTGRKKKTFTGASLTETQKQLFGVLRGIRASLAMEAGVPAYIICSDKTLSDLSTKVPENEEQMLHVYGMGAAKVNSYGKTFLDGIAKFLNERGQRREDVASAASEYADGRSAKGGGAAGTAGEYAGGRNVKGETVASAAGEDADERNVKGENVASEAPADESTSRAAGKQEKRPFSMPQEAWEHFQYEDFMKVKDIAQQLNELKGDNGTSNITAIQINRVLVEEGLLDNTVIDRKSVKRVTEAGRQIGISEEQRQDKSGHMYYAIIHNRNAQEQIIALLKTRYS